MLVLPPRATPWAASSSKALKHIFGDDGLGAQALAIFQSALQPGTLKNYDSNMSEFLEFCELYAIALLAVSPVDIACYISWLGERGTVAATSMQPYPAAINNLLQDHARTSVALGPLASGVRKSLEKWHRDDKPTPERLPLPAPVALSILKGAEHLLPLVQWDPLDPRLQLFRASVASISSYIFFNRGECSALYLAEGLVVTTDNITFRFGMRKERRASAPASEIRHKSNAPTCQEWDIYYALTSPASAPWALPSHADGPMPRG